MITLEQLLASRDARAARQKELLRAFPSSTLLCLTVQLPGAQKRNAVSLTIAGAAVEAIRKAFPIEMEELLDLETGYEGYFMLPLEALEVKRRACELEDSHPLGRLMDLDVISLSGILDRASIGLPPRKCLLCDNEARFCMRAKTHTTEELLSKIEQMTKDFVNLQ